jgi:protein SCO1/2
MSLRGIARLLGLVLAVLVAGSALGDDGPAPRVAFSLKTVAGRAVGVGDLPQRWLIVYFGYTFCPDICPGSMLDLQRVMDRLGPLADRIQPVFITIDPEHDTPELLSQYLAAIDPRILALTGSEPEIRAAAQQFHFYYVRYQDPSLGSYSIDHSSYFYVVDPQRRLVADFATPDRDSREIADALRLLLARPETSHTETAQRIDEGG